MDCMSLVLRQYRHLNLPCCALGRAWDKHVTGEAISTSSMQCVGAQLRRHAHGRLQDDWSAHHSIACTMTHVQEYVLSKGNTRHPKISMCCTMLIELIEWLTERHVVQACSRWVCDQHVHHQRLPVQPAPFSSALRDAQRHQG